MNRLLLITAFLFFSFKGLTQKNYSVGFDFGRTFHSTLAANEFSWNGGVVFSRNFLKDALFHSVSRESIKVGFDFFNTPDGKNVFGLDIDFKTYFPIRLTKGFDRQINNRIFLGLKYAFNKHARGCARPYNYNYIPNIGEECLVSHKIKSHNLYFLLGYERTIIRGLSAFITTGFGGNYSEITKNELFNYSISSGEKNRFAWILSLGLKCNLFGFKL